MSPKAQILLWVLCGFAVLALLLCSMLAINYRITAHHLKITWLGIPLRRIRLKDIRHIAVNGPWWMERWYSTFSVRNRRLVINRRRGLSRNFAISPKNPFVFKAELDRARKEIISPRPLAQPAEVPLANQQR